MRSWFLAGGAAVATVMLVGLADVGLWVWRTLVALGLVADGDCPGGLADGGFVQPMCVPPRGALMVGMATFIATGLVAAFVTRRITGQRNS